MAKGPIFPTITKYGFMPVVVYLYRSGKMIGLIADSVLIVFSLVVATLLALHVIRYQRQKDVAEWISSTEIPAQMREVFKALERDRNARAAVKELLRHLVTFLSLNQGLFRSLDKTQSLINTILRQEVKKYAKEAARNNFESYTGDKKISDPYLPALEKRIEDSISFNIRINGNEIIYLHRKLKMRIYIFSGGILEFKALG